MSFRIALCIIRSLLGESGQVRVSLSQYRYLLLSSLNHKPQEKQASARQIALAKGCKGYRCYLAFKKPPPG
ncbi:hypothetical protein BDR04DRAFT_1102087 [Suillus decipiens]|nr:hypothetical protein BDR04DRAFT_1102087 [Suillus decipiens]